MASITIKLLTPKALYNLDIGWGFQLLFALSSQVIGIALAGIFRRFLVWYVNRHPDIVSQF